MQPYTVQVYKYIVEYAWLNTGIQYIGKRYTSIHGHLSIWSTIIILCTTNESAYYSDDLAGGSVAIERVTMLFELYVQRLECKLYQSYHFRLLCRFYIMYNCTCTRIYIQ